MGDRAPHQWETSKPQTMHIEESGGDNALYNMPAVIDHLEAERYAEGLQKFTIEQVGSYEWMEQHRRLEKLNLQAHHNAMTNSDEYVLESLLTFDKLGVIIHDLLLIEAWKENVYPKLLDRVAGRNSMRIYFILYHEATLINLLEVILYHKHVCESGGEKLLELIDYIARKLTRLSSGYDFRDHSPKASYNAESNESNAKQFAEELEKRTPQEDLAKQLTEIEFKVCISAVSLCRFICEHADAIPLSVVSRITDTHDMLVLLVPLIENPPWTRRNESSGKWQKLIEQEWKDVLAIDLLKITKLEGQPWLALYHLMAKTVFRERYHLNTFRKAQALRVRKYINDIILDQLPILADIQRYMDELTLTEVPEPTSSANSVFMFQQVPVARESLIKDKNWIQVADEQMKNVFTMTDKDDKDLKMLADVYSDDLVENVLDPESFLKKQSLESEEGK
jgi:hypothetical protein